MKIGYARVSTKGQRIDRQVKELEKAKCKKIFKDRVTGVHMERPQLQMMLSQLRKGDVVVINKLDRLARSLKDLIHLVNEIQEKGASFISLQDNINTGSASGKLIFHVFGAIAEFERDLISERTKAGLKAARARGRVGGRPKGLSPEAKKTAMAAETLYKSRKHSIKEICSELSISRPTLYNYLRSRDVKIG